MNLPYINKTIGIVLIAAFVRSSLSVPQVHANELTLPMPGTRISLTPSFTPAIIRGMTIDAKNPFAFNFIIDQGNDKTPANEQKIYFQKLIEYFLAAMTIAEDKQWVNLSPYEKDRIIDADFGKTEMGRDLLAQDYILKQMTSSLLYPEDRIGKEFWQKVYQQAAEKYGTTQIPVNTYNKVWILPAQASVYEKDSTVLIIDSRLKVMLEEDYLSLQKHSNIQGVNTLGSQMVRGLILPALEKEVNEGKNFAPLRQMYQGMILATWYKQALKKSLLTQIYANQNKVKGIDLVDPAKSQQDIYQQYLKAFKKGVYNIIKEDNVDGKLISRKYFAGGFERGKLGIQRVDQAMAVPVVRKWGNSDLLTVSVVLSQPVDAAMLNERTVVRIIGSVLGAVAGTLAIYSAFIIDNSDGQKIGLMGSGTFLFLGALLFGASYIPALGEKYTQTQAANDNPDLMIDFFREIAEDMNKAKDRMQIDAQSDGRIAISIPIQSISNEALANAIRKFLEIDKEYREISKSPIIKDAQVEHNNESVTIIGQVSNEFDQFRLREIAKSYIDEFIEALAEGFDSPRDQAMMIKQRSRTALSFATRFLFTFLISCSLSMAAELYEKESPAGEILMAQSQQEDTVDLIVDQFIDWYTKKFYKTMAGIELNAADRGKMRGALLKSIKIQNGHVIPGQAIDLWKVWQEIKVIISLKSGEIVAHKTVEMNGRAVEIYYVHEAHPPSPNDNPPPAETIGNTVIIYLARQIEETKMLRKQDTAGIYQNLTDEQLFLSSTTESINHENAHGLTADDIRKKQLAGGFLDPILNQSFMIRGVHEISGILGELSSSQRPEETIFNTIGDFPHGYANKFFVGKMLDETKFGDFLTEKYAATAERKLETTGPLKSIPEAFANLRKAGYIDANNKIVLCPVLFDAWRNFSMEGDYTSEQRQAIYNELLRQYNPAIYSLLNASRFLISITQMADFVYPADYLKKQDELKKLLHDYLQPKVKEFQDRARALHKIIFKIALPDNPLTITKDVEAFIKRQYFPNGKGRPDKAMPKQRRSDSQINDTAPFLKGGIDMNVANLNLQIKRDGKGVPLPLVQQDMAQLSQIQGFVPIILEIKPATTLPLLSEFSK